MLMFTQRQQHIIDIMKLQRAYVTGKDLSTILDVSDRTIRNDIHAINEQYDHPCILSSVQNGYCLLEEQLFYPLILKKVKTLQTSQERQVYILHRLFYAHREVHMSIMQEETFVGYHSIRNDLHDLRELMHAFPTLRLLRVNNFISLQGSETTKRAYVQYVLEYYHVDGYFDVCCDNLKQDVIHDHLMILFQDNAIPLSPSSLTMLKHNIIIAMHRMFTHHCLSIVPYPMAQIPIKFSILAQDFLKKMTGFVALEVSQAEVDNLSYVLYQLQRLPMQPPAPCTLCSPSLFATIYKYYHINFANDDILRGELREWLFQLPTPSYDTLRQQEYELKLQHAYMLDIANYIYQQLQKKWKFPYQLMQVLTICELLTCAHIRGSTSPPHTVVLLCDAQQDVVQFCLQRLQQYFSSHLRILYSITSLDVSRLTLFPPQFLLTCIPIHHHLPFPTLCISAFLTMDDQTHIFHLLHELDYQQYYQDAYHQLHQLFQEASYCMYSDDSFSSVIMDITNTYIHKNIITSSYQEELSTLFSQMDMSYFLSIGLPHTLHTFAKQSHIVILHMSIPLLYHEQSLQYILFPMLCETDQWLLEGIYDLFQQQFSSPKQFALLLRCDDKASFIQQLFSLERRNLHE